MQELSPENRYKTSIFTPFICEGADRLFVVFSLLTFRQWRWLFIPIRDHLRVEPRPVRSYRRNACTKDANKMFIYDASFLDFILKRRDIRREPEVCV